MTGPISQNRFLGSLKEAVNWPEVHPNAAVVLAISLAATRADAEGARYFRELSELKPDDAGALAAAGFFEVRARCDLDQAIASLDRAVGMAAGLPQYFRGLAFADLLPGEVPTDGEPGPDEVGRADQVIADLEFVLAARDQFPVGLLRAAYLGLARAYSVLGQQKEADEALERSGLDRATTPWSPMFTGFSVTAQEGMRLDAPRVLSPAPGVHVAQSYDFADFSFIETSAGIVAIDAATSPDRVLAAMTDLGLKDRAPVSHLILTHAHFDHIGGSAALRGPDTEVITAFGFPAEAQRQREWSVPQYLTGTDAQPISDVEPDRLISEPTSVVIGETELELIPVRSGEITGALMAHLPSAGLLFIGDALMPYLGVPFTDEGSPEGLLESLRLIRELAPRQLIAGHVTITDNFTIEALSGLEPALTELYEFALDRIHKNTPLALILDEAYLPTSLKEHPVSVLPYLISRDCFIGRLYHQRTGYWEPDGQNIDPRSPAERAAALDLLAGGRADGFLNAAATLAEQGDLTLALEIVTPGLLRHPASTELAVLRQEVLTRLMDERQLADPFGFAFYAGLAGVELDPVG